MDYKRVLTIQDISCVGQCSLTVALPIISACGVETAVLPSAILSTHTAGFTGFTFRDLTDDMPAIRAHWEKEGLGFDAIYSGYLGSQLQIDYVSSFFATVGKEGCKTIVDPAMADNGRLYPGFDQDFVEAMKGLCAKAEYVLPNITEAAMMTGNPYQAEYDQSYIDKLLQDLTAMGCKNIILTGVGFDENTTGVVVYEEGRYHYYRHEKQPRSCHGTGDIFASSFVGALVRGKTAQQAAKIAADYVVECIRCSASLPDHWYGAAFEPVLGKLIQMVNE